MDTERHSGAASDGQGARGSSRGRRLWVVALCLVVWAVHLALAGHYSAKVTPDSASYIECSRSIRDGRGFMRRPSYGLGRDLWIPLRNFAPGYSLLTAALAGGGIADVQGGLVIAALCSGGFVVLVMGLCLAGFPALPAALLVVTILSMPAFMLVGTMCWSDGPYLLLSAISLLCIMKWAPGTKNSLRWIFAAGVAGGLSWCIRNVAVALFAATVLYFALSTLWQPFRASAKGAALWLIGWLGACGWLVCRNLAVFGRISPYHMPASRRSLWANTKDAWQMIVRGMVGSSGVGDVLGGAYVSVPLLVLALVAVCLWARRRGWPGVRKSLGENRRGLMLGGYAALYCATLIVARTKYEWAERINPRYLVQLYWILWIALAAGAAAVCRRVLATRKRANVALIIVLALAAAAQTTAEIRRLVWQRGRRTVALRSKRDAMWLGPIIPADKIVLSDLSKDLRIYGNVNARGFNRPWLGQQPLTMDQIRHLRAEGVLWGIVIGNVEKCARGDYGPALAQLARHPRRGSQFEVIDIGSKTLVLRCVARRGRTNTASRPAGR